MPESFGSALWVSSERVAALRSSAGIWQSNGSKVWHALRRWHVARNPRLVVPGLHLPLVVRFLVRPVRVRARSIMEMDRREVAGVGGPPVVHRTRTSLISKRLLGLVK